MDENPHQSPRAESKKPAKRATTPRVGLPVLVLVATVILVGVFIFFLMRPV